MIDAVDRCRAEILRLQAIAERATTGPWKVGLGRPYGGRLGAWIVRGLESGRVAEASSANAAHIAACDPQVMIRRYDIDLDRLDEHVEDCGACYDCLQVWPCITVEAVLACYPQDGAGSGRGGSEPGTPSSLPDPPAEKPQNGAGGLT